MAILVIRHGETAANVERIVQTPETPLNDRGRRQAELLAARLARFKVARLLSSDLARAVMTAQALAARCLRLEIETLLQERNFGELRGRSYSSIGRDIFADGYEPPGGESWETFHRRVDAAWRAIQERALGEPGHLAVVTHGLVCRSLAARHWRLPAGIAPPERWGNTSLTVVEPAMPLRPGFPLGPSPSGSPTGSWSVSLLNCTDHLVGEARDAGVPSGL